MTNAFLRICSDVGYALLGALFVVWLGCLLSNGSKGLFDAQDGDGEDGPTVCGKCGGSGFFSDCIDDMCHGQERCIHGDDSTCTGCDGERWV